MSEAISHELDRLPNPELYLGDDLPFTPLSWDMSDAIKPGMVLRFRSEVNDETVYLFECFEAPHPRRAEGYLSIFNQQLPSEPRQPAGLDLVHPSFVLAGAGTPYAELHLPQLYSPKTEKHTTIFAPVANAEVVFVEDVALIAEAEKARQEEAQLRAQYLTAEVIESIIASLAFKASDTDNVARKELFKLTTEVLRSEFLE